MRKHPSLDLAMDVAVFLVPLVVTSSISSGVVNVSYALTNAWNAFVAFEYVFPILSGWIIKLSFR